MKSRASVSLFLFLVAFAPPVLAQTDAVAAQALFDDAKKLMANNEVDAACPKFAESQRLDPGVGTLLNLAECWDKSGKTARAWATFRDAEAMAIHERQVARAQYAASRAVQLESRLARLTIDVPENARVPSLEVTRDGEVVRDASWGSAVPIDPGDHVVEARAPGYKTFSTHVSAARDAIVLHLTPLEKENGEGSPPPSSTTTTAPTVVETLPPPIDTAPPLTIENAPRDKVIAPEASSNTVRTAGFVVGGFGVAGLGFGALFGVLAIGSNNTARSAGCGDATCPTPNALGAANDAKMYAVGSDIAFTAGAVLVAASIVLLAVAPRAPMRRVARAVMRGGFSF